MLLKLAIANYRSIRDLVIPLDQLNLITGPNGSGKSNLYRALRLLAEIAQGRIVSTLAHEGGFASTLWAGPESHSRAMLSGEQPVQGTVRKKPVNLRLGFSSDEFTYCIDLGLPAPGAIFGHDAEIKRECLWYGDVMRPSCLFADRKGPLARIRGEDEEWLTVLDNIATFDSMMTQCSDPRSTPEILILRETMRGWRFYDSMRTDPQAPARMPRVGTFSPVLDDAGTNLASAILTIEAIGDRAAFRQAISDAFPGARAGVAASEHGWLEVEMSQHGILRPLKAAELSDGTLRYILLVAALLTPRPPALMVLNEPESSLHPDLFPALARLIAQASKHSQVIVVSHAAGLIEELEKAPSCNSLRLEKQLGATRVADQDELTKARWEWPGR